MTRQRLRLNNEKPRLLTDFAQKLINEKAKKYEITHTSKQTYTLILMYSVIFYSVLLWKIV